MVTETQPEVKKMSLGVKIALGVAGFVVLVGMYAYNRYWNIVTVNGQPISRLAYYQALDRQYGPETLNNLITQSLVAQAAREKGLVIEPAAVEAEISKITNNLTAQGKNLDEVLAAEKMTRAQLETQIRNNLTLEALGHKEVTITEEQIKSFIEENKAIIPSTLKGEELKALAKEQLTNQQQEQNIQEWLDQQRKSAQINFY